MIHLDWGRKRLSPSPSGFDFGHKGIFIGWFDYFSCLLGGEKTRSNGPKDSSGSFCRNFSRLTDIYPGISPCRKSEEKRSGTREQLL